MADIEVDDELTFVILHSISHAEAKVTPFAVLFEFLIIVFASDICIFDVIDDALDDALV